MRALSIDKIAGVFSGEITDWAQVSAARGRINLYVRDEKLGQPARTGARNRKVLLLGFAGSQAASAANLALARVRAEEV